MACDRAARRRLRRLRPGAGPALALLAAALLGADAQAQVTGARPIASLPEVEAPAEPVRPDVAVALPGLVGQLETVFVDEGESLVEIAHEHRVGFESLERLNPTIDPWIPPPGTVIWLPTRSILPEADHEGLVINVPEMRLYDFTVEPVETFAIAVGDAEDPSPIGEYRIGEKHTDPAWHVPSSIREEKPWLPAVVPPGEDNPLGKRWMTIGRTSYGIHGTNMRWSIGRTSTHGCIRLYEDQVARLYERTPTGLRVQLVYQPIKWGLDGDTLYIEVHPDIYDRSPIRLGPALEKPRALGLLDHVDLEGVIRALREKRGIPVEVGRIPVGRAAPPEPATSRPTS